MVSSDPLGQLRNRQGSVCSQPRQQGEQRTVQRHSSQAQQEVIASRTVEESRQVEQGAGQRIILRVFCTLYATPRLSHNACMIHAFEVFIIIGSVRSRRICPKVAAWVGDVGRGMGPWALDLVDLRDWSLPMDDEPEMPQHGVYANARTRDWSAKIAAADAMVFVTPQYNWGYPAALKNALDHLYTEWAGKPALIVTYGGHGGGKCAAQLREVLNGLRMAAVPTMPALVLARHRIEANAGEIEPAVEFAQHRPVLEEAFAELAAALRSPARH